MPTTDHLAARQNALPEAAPEELNGFLDAVVNHFGMNWLTAVGENPVQVLWVRKDALATNELLLLGNALTNLAGHNPKWVEQQVTKAKSSDQGQRNGALFELLGLNLFNVAGQTVEPARDDTPGYDGKVTLSDGSCVLLSIKNHGLSTHERTFRQKADEVLQAFQASMRKHNCNGLEIRAIATSYPSYSSWNDLSGSADAIIGGNYATDEGIWSGCIRPLSSEYNPLSDRHTSYTFLLAAPHHENEQKNFFENIRKGLANLQKHWASVPSNVCRAILLRLSATASLPQCQQWAEQYFRDWPDANVELILLYQVAPVLDLVTGKTTITHYFITVAGPKHAAWKGKREARQIRGETMIGKISNMPLSQMAIGGPSPINLDAFYTFQRGDIYRFYRSADGPLELNLENPAPGVLIHALTDNLGTLAMRAPPTGDLLLLP
ncbi:hypothetical protein ACO2I3_08895 [Leptospira interrogans]